MAIIHCRAKLSCFPYYKSLTVSLINVIKVRINLPSFETNTVKNNPNLYHQQTSNLQNEFCDRSFSEGPCRPDGSGPSLFLQKLTVDQGHELPLHRTRKRLRVGRPQKRGKLKCRKNYKSPEMNTIVTILAIITENLNLTLVVKTKCKDFVHLGICIYVYFECLYILKSPNTRI